MKIIIYKIYNIIWSFLEFTRISFFFWKILAHFSPPLIICYHRISEDKLVEQVQLINKFFNLSKLDSLLQSIFGELKLNKRSLVTITMDDCYRSDFLIAYKVFNKLKVPCTFFIPTGYSKNNDTLYAKKLIKLFDHIDNYLINEFEETIYFKNSEEKKKYYHYLVDKYLWNNIQTNLINIEVDKICKFNNYEISNDDIVISSEEIKKYSMSSLFNFQSHTVSHPKLFICSKQELMEEFAEAKKYLFEASNNIQNIICYPYGSSRHISSSFNIAENYYDYGLSLEMGTVNAKKSKMMIPRIGLYEKDTSASIFAKFLFAQFK